MGVSGNARKPLFCLRKSDSCIYELSNSSFPVQHWLAARLTALAFPTAGELPGRPYPLPSLLKLGTKEANGLHQHRLEGREPCVEETVAYFGETA